MRTQAFGVALALAAASLASRRPRPSPAPAVDRDTQARVWVTTPDRAELLHERAPVTFQRGASDRTTITVDPRTSYQTMDGFGASITDSSANVLYRLSPADREQTLRKLFDPSRASA